MARQGRLGFWYLLAIALLKPPTLLFTRRDWRGAEHVPDGGVIVAANHISLFDPIALCDFVLYGLLRAPRFMAKSEMFEGNGLVARVMRGADQIPVHRNREDASASLEDAVAALRRGEAVVIYPEGTVTRDPLKWPMVARTGVARLALLSGAPVVPIAQWGAQEVHDSYRTKGLHLLPPHRMHMLAGPPVDLSPWLGKPLTGAVLREATDAVMDAITAQLEVLRGEPVPATRHDHRAVKAVAETDGRRSA